MNVDKFQNKLFIIIILLIAASFYSCDDSLEAEHNVRNQNHTAKEAFEYRLPVTGNLLRLSLTGINSGINITGDEDITEVIIKGERIVRSDSDEDARAYLEKLIVNVNTESDYVNVFTEQPAKNYGREFLVNYDIVLPADWLTQVKNINGDIKISSLSNDVIVENINGKVDLDNIRSGIDVNLVNGNITAQLNLLPVTCNCIIKNVNGKIELEIPKTSSANITASVVLGNIVTNSLNLSNIQSSPTRLSGVLNSGESDIDLSLTNGDIIITGF